MEEKIKIKLTSKRYALDSLLLHSLFEDNIFSKEDDQAGFDPKIFSAAVGEAEEETIEVMTEGILRQKGNLCEIIYEESELTGMAGAKTSVSFRRDNGGLVSMMRCGTVKTALIFEAGRRHICVYHTPFAPFTLCVCSHKVDNRLLTEGRLFLDYAVEIRGAQAERTRFTMEIKPFREEDYPVSRPPVMISVEDTGL